ncbi:MAG: hypothetical protein AB1631_00865 [Acidobacteriota bacterium]
MVSTKSLLIRLLEIVGDSAEYFVSGSLSFLPLTGNYRQPAHDLDAAISKELFHARKHLFHPSEHIHYLSLSEVAIASESSFARAFSPQTEFVHVDGVDGLLDLSCYRRKAGRFIFALGAGLALEIPEVITERFRLLNWEGISYQAAPPELAFIPKAVWYLRNKHLSEEMNSPDRKHFEDMRHLVKIIDWGFVSQLLEQGGVRWLGYKLPEPIKSWVDPFAADEIMMLQNKEIT